jgi:hypothetical protein
MTIETAHASAGGGCDRSFAMNRRTSWNVCRETATRPSIAVSLDPAHMLNIPRAEPVVPQVDASSRRMRIDD